MKIKLSSKDIRKLLDVPPPELPTYVAPLLNLANRFARGTVPSVVGQMSELIQEFGGKTLGEWALWYQKKHPAAIKDATKLVKAKLLQYRGVIDKITDEMIEEWVRDLVVSKTFIGLRAQEAILQKLAKEFGQKYRLSTPAEEAKGIDGFIGGTPVSVKPLTYKTQPVVRESLPQTIVFYEKDDNGNLVVQFDESDFKKSN